MGRMSLATRSRVVSLSQSGYPISKIQKHLEKEGTMVSKKSLHLLLKKYKMTGSVADHRTVKPPRKLGDEHYRFIDDCMASDDELTAKKLRDKLLETFPGLNVSVSMVKRARMELGWTAKKTRYGALVSESNQEKRVVWCNERMETNDMDFDDVVFSDECTVQLESHRRVTFYKKGQPVRYKMKAKHPPKVNVWAGISSRGATNVVVFTGTLTATRYVDILEAALIPFLDEVYPDGHRFQQDNDPKHTSRYAKDYIEEKGVNWFKTPASSPDLNPIELMWHALKDYLRNEYKPKNLGELKSGIRAFWATLTPSICKKYINHLIKVIPKVIEVQGLPSGY